MLMSDVDSDRADDRQLRLITGGESAQTDHPTPQEVVDFFDPARVTQARHIAGLTKKAVADAVGVSPAAVGQYETGAARPRPELLVRLAETLNVPLGFFLAGRPHGRIAATGPHFRSLRSMRVYQRDKAIAAVEQVWELAHELERHVELPPVRLPGHDPESSVYDDDGQNAASAPAAIDPTAAARQLRRTWGLGDGPVQHLVRRLEANGVIIVTPPPDPDAATVDAFSTSGLPRPIVVLTPNRADDVHRHRFTAAHELGHLVLHRDAVGTDITREREADQFAAELLTPRESILPLLPRRLDLRRLAELARTWGVSVHSLLYRCRETGLLSDSAASRGYQRLHTLRDQPGFRPEPVANFPHEQPIMLRKAFEVASDSGLTIDALAAQLGWTPHRCRELLGIASPIVDRRRRLQLIDQEL
jgi:Zn-dependent peptidase ImmA (M78 family)/transcriptional regulator with XRE-family HTH domain